MVRPVVFLLSAEDRPPDAEAVVWKSTASTLKSCYETGLPKIMAQVKNQRAETRAHPLWFQVLSAAQVGVCVCVKGQSSRVDLKKRHCGRDQTGLDEVLTKDKYRLKTAESEMSIGSCNCMMFAV